MTKITEDISKQIYDLWNEGNLTKAEVAEKFNTSEDVVKYHIQKHKVQSVSHAPATGDESQKSIKGFLKGLLGKENKDKIIEQLADKLEELTARLEQLPTARTEKPTEQKLTKRYISKVEGLLLNSPAVILHKDQKMSVVHDTEEILRAVSDGILVPEDVPSTAVKGVDEAEFSHLKEKVIQRFEEYYAVAQPCTKDKIERFVDWYRGTESSVLPADAVRKIAMEVVIKATGGHGLVLSPDEELERLRQMDKSKMPLFDLKKIDRDAYKIRAITEKFQEYMCSLNPLETSENFINAFKRYDNSILPDEVRDIMWTIVKKNQREAEELHKIALDILKERREQGISVGSVA
ncbi:MAG: hypothetical protein O8C61_02540 [Candidatus Methanoperedens sp.]|nr:hypothetical protein [Candidatus Methanoperedens sp.]